MVYFGSLIMFVVCICEYLTLTGSVCQRYHFYLTCSTVGGYELLCVCVCVFLGYMLFSASYYVCVKVSYSNTTVLMAGKRRWQKTEPTSKTSKKDFCKVTHLLSLPHVVECFSLSCFYTCT